MHSKLLLDPWSPDYEAPARSKIATLVTVAAIIFPHITAPLI